jgi:hypothetical protein
MIRRQLDPEPGKPANVEIALDEQKKSPGSDLNI